MIPATRASGPLLVGVALDRTTPHGIWVEKRGDAPVQLVADRENQHLQVFDLGGKPLREIKDLKHDLCAAPATSTPVASSTSWPISPGA